MLWLPLPPLPRFFAIAGLFILASSGCMTMNPGYDITGLTGADNVAPILPPPGPLNQAPPRQVLVQMRPIGGNAEMVQVKMDQDESVESVLDKAKATSRFRRMKISLFRAGRGGAMANEPLRVEFDSAARRIPVQYDYAMQPGDKLLVVEDSRTAYEDLMVAVFGPFAGPR